MQTLQVEPLMEETLLVETLMVETLMVETLLVEPLPLPEKEKAVQPEPFRRAALQTLQQTCLGEYMSAPHRDPAVQMMQQIQKHLLFSAVCIAPLPEPVREHCSAAFDSVCIRVSACSLCTLLETQGCSRRTLALHYNAVRSLAVESKAAASQDDGYLCVNTLRHTQTHSLILKTAPIPAKCRVLLKRPGLESVLPDA